MKITLAGFNVEIESLNRALSGEEVPLTPEVISAAYARISRDPRSIGAIRSEARESVERARKSNERIIFGFGHSSVAEHAVFNFDIIGISRLAVEELEHFRIASFTEKSQRYIKLGKDLVIPEEISASGLKGTFGSVAKELHRAYERMYRAMTKRGEDEGVAKEDARYVMPLATTAQLGMTINARELEYMVSRLAAHPLSEIRMLSSKLSDAVIKHAPSLIRYPEPTDYFRNRPSVRSEIAGSLRVKTAGAAKLGGTVSLVDVTPDGDRKLAAAILFSSLNVSMKDAEKTASKLSAIEIERLVARTMRDIQPHDSVWREFENIHMLFELTVSASCFAQLKRHRIATLIPQPYETSLGFSIPESIRKAKRVGALRSAIRKSEKLYRKIRAHNAPAADYALINAHRRRVLLGLNLRELYHFSRLRSDRHAQWEIRGISIEMCRIAARELPAGAVLLAGKDRFQDVKKSRNL